MIRILDNSFGWLLGRRSGQPLPRRWRIRRAVADGAVLAVMYALLFLWVRHTAWWLAAPNWVRFIWWGAPAFVTLCGPAVRHLTRARLVADGLAVAGVYLGTAVRVIPSTWWSLAPLWVHVIWWAVPGGLALTSLLQSWRGPALNPLYLPDRLTGPGGRVERAKLPPATAPN